MTAEQRRLEEDRDKKKNWKRWGPYLSERQWGTVREDYSPDGSCWDYFPHDHARSRAYRWGEDGLMGITDRQCRLCFALALWNGKDAILKERLYGLTGPEGNHGEDVKECYFYIESLPTHSYMKALYKYPQSEFPYAQLSHENRRRSMKDPEFELLHTGIFDSSDYFDVFAEYAKVTPDDILIKLTVVNRSKTQTAPLHILPTLWFRNSWSWGRSGEGYTEKPSITLAAPNLFECQHPNLGQFSLSYDDSCGPARALLTDNETNMLRLFNSHPRPKVKDSFHDYVIRGAKEMVGFDGSGTKGAFYQKVELAPGQSAEIRLRLSSKSDRPAECFGSPFAKIFADRLAETDEFYKETLPPGLTGEEQRIMRQSYGGLMWSKQFYWYCTREWWEGDPTQPPPAGNRRKVRNSDWPHLYNRDVISMPDKWEYPWYAAWDLAFHMIPYCKVDPDFAKEQLILLLREWYMHPNGQIPAYEFAFSDVNPPVHAWACWRMYKMSAPRGQRDITFLGRVFHKLLLNFTWWVNRKDIHGNNLFSGGFLGLDNIGVFDRARPEPFGSHLEQADATAWMAFYCLTMLSMSLELARHDSAYADVTSKFFEHFIAISDAINTLGGTGLWDQLDGFYYDQLHVNDTPIPLRVRSMVGIIPMLAVEVLEDDDIDCVPGFQKRMNWFLDHRKDLARYISFLGSDGAKSHPRRLLAVPSRERLERMLRYILDEREFLSPYGVRSVSKIHGQYPYVYRAGQEEHRVDYTPGESETIFFGGNSNWRGPIWFPLNFLLVEALERYHHFYGDDFLIECPTGSGIKMNLKQVSIELANRLSAIFRPGPDGQRPCHGTDRRYAEDPAWKDLVLFYEYFHGDTGQGLGANHQTGWTALVSRCFDKVAYSRSDGSKS